MSDEWTVSPDADGDLTLWHGDIAILRQFEVESHSLRQAELPLDLLWSVLRRVLAPDEAAVERLARACYPTEGFLRWENISEGKRQIAREDVRYILAALADTRDTSTEAVDE